MGGSDSAQSSELLRDTYSVRYMLRHKTFTLMAPTKYGPRDTLVLVAEAGTHKRTRQNGTVKWQNLERKQAND